MRRSPGAKRRRAAAGSFPPRGKRSYCSGRYTRSERSGGAFAVATVGLTDPRDEGVRLALGKAVRASLPAPLRERVLLFHLRGGIDYGRLTFAHGLLMKMMYAAQKKVSEEKKSAQERVIAQTYGSSADFTDFSALPAIAEEIEKV